MFKPRHPAEIDRGDSRLRFSERMEGLPRTLELARRPDRSDILSSLVYTADYLWEHGMRCDADPVECCRALTLAARARAALFVFDEIREPLRRWSLEEGEPVAYSKPVDESHLHSGKWCDAVIRSIITRQSDCLRELRYISFERLSISSSYSPNRKWDYHTTELHRVLASAAVDPTLKVALYFKQHEIQSRSRKLKKVIERARDADHRLMEALDEGSPERFNATLAERLDLSFKILDAQPDPEIRRNVAVLWPLQLNAVVAIARDRGFPIEVESDYLPRFWVSGEYFRRPADESDS